jgi:DNA replication protein
MNFSGFPRSVRCTPIPDPLLGSLLEQISDIAELKVALRGIWLLQQERGSLPVVSVSQLLSDRVLIGGLKTPGVESSGDESQGRVLRGFQAAVDRGIFLNYRQESSRPEDTFFLLNTEAGRRALGRLTKAGAVPVNSSTTGTQLPASSTPVPSIGEKPNIFARYEDNIGTISPMLAEELKEAETEYSCSWIDEAFKIAVTQNKRNWGYISAILRRWAAEGRDGSKQNGKSGRHTQEDNPEKYIEEYQRRRGHLPWESPGKSSGQRPNR